MDSRVRVVRHSSANANPQMQSLQGSQSLWRKHALRACLTESCDAVFYGIRNPQLSAGGFVPIRAFAKINLFLDVVGKRHDGYHHLVSVMQSLEMCDDLEFYACEESIISFEVSGAADDFPLDDSNLILRAAQFLIDAYNIRQGVKIKLQKRIPMGAGLGGGSSDCAATLHGLNNLFGLDIPLPQLIDIGQKFGADVPFCLMGGTALAQGIGEQLTPLSPHPPCYIVLACPDIHVSTGEMFRRLDLSVEHRIDHNSFIAAYKTGKISTIAESFYNIFTPITSTIHPKIAELIAALNKLGAINASMTGTGSTVFGYFENENDAHIACNQLDAKTFLTKPV